MPCMLRWSLLESNAPANNREDQLKSGRYIGDVLCSPQYVSFSLSKYSAAPIAPLGSALIAFRVDRPEFRT